MAKEARNKTKEERIRSEKARLKKIFKKLPENAKKIALPLIERASFMRIELEDLEEDLKEYGWTELFQQSEKIVPYKRQRPEGQTYNTVNTSYQKIMKQLFDMIPGKDEQPAGESPVGSFMNFINERE